MSGHTEGPWMVSNDEAHIDGCRVTDGVGLGRGPIAIVIRRGAPWTCKPGLEADEANARLIAAAPALLNALCDLVIATEGDSPEVLAAQAAIKTATGKG